MIKNEDLETFRGQYPYGSELFGVYQTLLGWRGAHARNWFLRGYARDRSALRDSIFKKLRPMVEAHPNEDGVLAEIGRIDVARPNDEIDYGSRLLKSVSERLDDGNHDDPDFWRHALSDDVLARQPSTAT
jgi:hypothetical protein